MAFVANLCLNWRQGCPEGCTPHVRSMMGKIAYAGGGLRPKMAKWFLSDAFGTKRARKIIGTESAGPSLQNVSKSRLLCFARVKIYPEFT